MLLFPTKRARFDPTENFFGGDPTLRRFAGTPIEGRFRVLHPNDALSELAAFTSGAPPSVGGENSPSNGVRRVKQQLRRTARNAVRCL